MKQAKDPGFIAQQKSLTRASHLFDMAGVTKGRSGLVQLEIIGKHIGSAIVDVLTLRPQELLMKNLERSFGGAV